MFVYRESLFVKKLGFIKQFDFEKLIFAEKIQLKKMYV
jgi:hypothetical protein